MIINHEDPRFGIIQNIKRRFFALRNGDIAAVYRKAGAPHRIVFGLQLPQIKEIAQSVATDNEVACQLWNNTSTRESRLLAPMLVDAATLPHTIASQWATTVMSVEEADVLCHSLLRKTPYAMALARELLDSHTTLTLYTGVRLVRNLVYSNPRWGTEIVNQLLADGKLKPGSNLHRLALEIIEEADFLTAPTDNTDALQSPGEPD